MIGPLCLMTKAGCLAKVQMVYIMYLWKIFLHYAVSIWYVTYSVRKFAHYC